MEYTDHSVEAVRRWRLANGVRKQGGRWVAFAATCGVIVEARRFRSLSQARRYANGWRGSRVPGIGAFVRRFHSCEWRAVSPWGPARVALAPAMFQLANRTALDASEAV